MKKRLLTLLLVLVVLVSVTATVGFAASTETLTANVDSKTISEDTELNLAGYTIGTLTVNEGVTVTISGAGTTGVITTVNGGGTVVLADGFMLLGGASNKLTLGTAGVSLRMGDLKTVGASAYYTSTFGGNAAVKDQIVAYGVAMGAGSAPKFADKTYTRNEDLSGWKTDSVFNDNGVLLKGIMKSGNTLTINKGNSLKKIYNVAYVELADGTRITSNPKNTTLKNMTIAMTAMNDGSAGFWNNLSIAQKNTLITLYESFENVVKPWATPGLDLVKESTGDTYDVYTASDLAMISENPTLDYVLKNNIDMDGAAIDGAVNFTGSIVGNGYTVSDVTINGVGLVDTVASGEYVTDLHLRDVKVVVPSTATATAVGMIAGTNNGSVTGVTVTGSLKDTRAGSEDAMIYAGVIVGNNAGTVTAGTTNTITVSTATEKSLDENGNVVESVRNTVTSDGIVTVDEAAHTTTGLVADAGLWMSETSDYVVRGGLVGTGTAATNAGSVYWSDRSYSTERQAAELQRRRLVVEDDVYAQGTIKWTPATTIKYWNDKTNAAAMEKGETEKVWVTIWGSYGYWKEVTVGYHIHNRTFNAGQTYIGIPYTHCASPIDQAMYYMTEGANGVYTLNSEVTSITGGPDNVAGESTWTGGGSIGWGSYFGSDCSGGLTGAWHKVSPILTSSKNNGGVCLEYTKNMVPSQYNQWYYGFRQVGDYEVDDATWSTWGSSGDDVTAGGVTMKDYTVTTEDIYQKIGETGMYEAYAQSQMGDIAVAYEKAPDAESADVGHARLIAADPVVIRNGNNEIDGSKSYFLFHEQGAGLYDTHDLCSWRINWKCSFTEAALLLDGQTYGGNGNGRYLPITMNAFHDTKIAATGGLASGGNVITGNDPIKYALNSSYRIMSATMIIKDAAGNTVYEATRFQGTSSNQARRRAVPGSIPLFASDLFKDCDDNLVEGNTYYVTFSGTTYGGVTNVKMNNYKIVYAPTATS